MNQRLESPPPFEEDDDDRPIGRVLTRREVLALFGTAGVAVAIAACAPGAVASIASALPSASPASGASGAVGSAAASSAATAAASASAVPSASAAAVASLPSCIVRPAETEGPYFVDVKLNRSDIRSDTADGSVQAGLPLVIKFLVSKVSGSNCVPFADALVDVWHCNAAGVYSDVSQQSSVGHTYLRGYQTTDSNGLATITTIFPGWYQGRTVHIHFKIRTDAGASSGTEFTSQLFFDDTLTDQVFALAPYAAKGTRSTRNADDGIYGSGGDQLLLAPTGDPATGLEATFEVGIQTS